MVNCLKVGGTYLILFLNGDNQQDFKFNPEIKECQYMVCYTQIENSKLTQQICKFLLPIEFGVADKLP